MVGSKAVVFLLCALMMSSVLIHLPAAEAQGNPHDITLACSSPVEIHVSPDESGWGWGICTISNPTIHQVDTIVETDWSGETDHPESVTVPAGTAIMKVLLTSLYVALRVTETALASSNPSFLTVTRKVFSSPK